MTEFTPVSGLVGGALIGLSAALLLVLNGRIAGISGIFGGLLSSGQSDRWWRAAFIAGLPLGALLVAAVNSDAVPAVTLSDSYPVLIIGGLLVGLGTRVGNGCTSGHGICGIARFSVRSIAATATFFAVAAITVFVARHVL